MNILHIIGLNEKNSYNLFKQLHEYCDLDGHTFLVADFKSNLKNFPKLQEFTNFKFMDSYSKSRIGRIVGLYKQCNKADHIIINSLLFKTKKYLLFFYIFRKFLKKSTWIEWGKDLYEYELPPFGIKNKFLNHIGYYIRNNVKYVGLTFQNDEAYYRSQFPESTAKCFYTPLPFGEGRINTMHEAMEEAEANKTDTINVLISHNAMQSNNHFNTIFKMKRFADKNVNFYFPVSYGWFGQPSGLAYKNALVKYVKKTFGSKAVIMNNMMPIEEYIHFLAKMDIGVFDCDRPIGLSSTYYLMYMGKKVYLSETAMHTKYFKENGYELFYSQDIDNMTWDNFISPCEKQQPKELEEMYIVGKSIMNWQHLFDTIKEELNK